MVDKSKLFGGILRAGLTAGSFSRISSWVAAKPNERTASISIRYVPTDDLPDARWKLVLTDTSWPAPRQFEASAFDSVVFEAVVSLGK